MPFLLCLFTLLFAAEKQGNSLRVRMGQLRRSPPPDKTISTAPRALTNGPYNGQVVQNHGGAVRNNRSIACRSLRSGRSKNVNCGRAKNAPRGATWVQSVNLAGREMEEVRGCEG